MEWTPITELPKKDCEVEIKYQDKGEKIETVKGNFRKNTFYFYEGSFDCRFFLGDKFKIKTVYDDNDIDMSGREESELLCYKIITPPVINKETK